MSHPILTQWVCAIAAALDGGAAQVVTVQVGQHPTHGRHPHVIKRDITLAGAQGDDAVLPHPFIRFHPSATPAKQM